MFGVTMKDVIIVAAVVVASDYIGNKLANKITGPELTQSDKWQNTAKIYGVKVGIGVVGFVLGKAVAG